VSKRGWQFEDPNSPARRPLAGHTARRLQLAEKGIRPARMADRHRGVDACGRARRPDDTCADRRHAGIEPRPRSRVQYFTEGSPLGAPEAEERPMTVWIYVDTGKQVGDREHLQVFASEDAAETWLQGKRLGRRGFPV
jgi:hypothetical protein